MKTLKKYKVHPSLLIILFSFIVISLITIGSAEKLISSNNLVIKQLLWYVVGFIFIFFIMKVGNGYIYKNTFILYIIGIISLAGLLMFAEPINNARCWYSIPGIGTIQPSEFMKIILILTLATTIKQFNDKYPNPTLMEEFKFLIKVSIIVFIPSILTFLQPDTGVVLIYLLITIIMLFISGIRYRWFIIFFSTLLVLVLIILGIYFINTDLFIKLFGTSFFLRIDRLLDWSNNSGYQLQNGLASIGSGGLFGLGINNTPIYFPEPQTDFIFAVYANNFGFIGNIILIFLLTIFDIILIQLGKKNNRLNNKYVIAGIVGMLIYQQLQNIGMTFGLMPITGITLPFISYGGSSLISYMIMMGIIFNISNDTLKYTN